MSVSAIPWAEWPDAQAGEELVDVSLGKNVDELVVLLFGGWNDLRDELISVLQNKNYRLTAWSKSPELGDVGDSARPCLKSSDEFKPGLFMIRDCQSPAAMGSIYQSTERLKVVQAEPGQSFVIDNCVVTGAPYGDKFRVVLRHTFQPMGPRATHYTVRYAFVYLSKVNGMIQGMINRGAKDGMSKHSAAMLTVLRKRMDVTPFAAAVARPPSAESAASAPPEVAAVTYSSLKRIFGTQSVEAFEPWAGFIRAMLAHLPFVGDLVTMPLVIGALCFVFTIGGLRLGLAVLRFFESAGKAPEDVLAWAAHHILKIVHVPSGLNEIFFNYLYVFLIVFIINHMAAALPSPRIGGNVGSSSRRPAAEDGEAAGVKYDGYNRAISAATSQLGLGHSNGVDLDSINNKSEAALQRIQQGLNRMVGPFTPLGPQKIKEAYKKGHNHKHTRHRNHDRGGARHRHALPSDSSGAPADSHQSTATSEEGGNNDNGSPHSNKNNKSLQQNEIEARGYEAPDVPPALRGQGFVEVVYENERFQPFRGWGHTWPGHFLPTDRALRWSIRDAQGTEISASQYLDEVAPLLPEGWRWVEHAWRLDLSGALSDSTDNDGWSYGIDFPWVTYPFAPGTGKKHLADFVRRRRWLRTRVPVLDEEEETESTSDREGEYSDEAGSEQDGAGKFDAEEEEEEEHDGGSASMKVEAVRTGTRAAMLDAMEQDMALLIDERGQEGGVDEENPSGFGSNATNRVSGSANERAEASSTTSTGPPEQEGAPEPHKGQDASS